MYRVGIVAAMEREVRPLVRRWRVAEKEYSGRSFRFFENGDSVLVCGGIGAGPARRAAEAMIALYAPAAVWSAGFAGALDPKLKVGDVVLPRWVVNSGDASRVEMPAGGGVLVTSAAVADPAQKAKLRESFSADAVDMEAAAVAAAAQVRDLPFAAVKVISDDFDFDFPSTERFIDSQGHFLEWRFALYTATRPWLWPSVFRLAGNSRRASRVLSDWLVKNIDWMAKGARLESAAPEAVNQQ